MAWTYFDDVLDAFVGFLPAKARSFSSKVMWTGLKVWLADEPKEHFEAQFHGRKGDRLEIGFHAEHPRAERNDEVIASLLASERTWRKTLGPEPEVGAFLGQQRKWRRVSEVWEGDGLLEPETAVEAAERLAQYVQVLGPLLPSPARTATPHHPFSG